MYLNSKQLNYISTNY